MKKTPLFAVLGLALLFTSCTREEPMEDTEEVEMPTVEDTEESVGVEELGSCSTDDFTADAEKLDELGVHPDQITDCYNWGDLKIAFVSQPNSYTSLTTVREWEVDGHTAWSGLLVQGKSGIEEFLKLAEDDFNPVNLHLNSNSLSLDIVDDSGAGSGEGKLLRYNYTNEWVKDTCEGYYVPETYSYARAC